MRFIIIINILSIFFNSHFLYSQNTDKNIFLNDSVAVHSIIKEVSFKNADLRDVIRLLSQKFKLNVIVSNDVNLQVTFDFHEISLADFLWFLHKQYDLEIKKWGAVYSIHKPTHGNDFVCDIHYDAHQKLISARIEDTPMKIVIDSLIEKTGANFVFPTEVNPKMNVTFKNLPLKEGLKLLFRQNGFEMIERKNLYEIRKMNVLKDYHDSAEFTNANLWIQVEDSLISVDAQNTPLSILVNQLFLQLPFQHVVYTDLTGSLSIKIERLHLTEVLDLLFNNTSYTYRREGNIFLIGSKEMKGMTTQKLIAFNFLKVSDVMNLIPLHLKEHLQLLSVKEHNAIFAIGPIDLIKEMEQFRNAIDRPVAQVLLEVIVVDFSSGNIKEFKIEAQKGNTAGDSISSLDTFIPGYDILLSATNVNKYYDEIGKFFGFKNIGKLPSDFKLRLKALEQKKIAHVRSRPQLATLNGHTAKMDIGFTQYYKLNSRTAIPGTIYSPFNPGQNGGQNQDQDFYNPYFTTERFVSIQATISLEITPWVSSNGEITVEIHPKFETPVGKLDASTPPTIQKREISSTVRLKDGETIILGGLIENKEEETVSQLPVLGDIPLLGNLFKSKNFNKSKQELIIYITPHLYYGNEESNSVVQ